MVAVSLVVMEGGKKPPGDPGGRVYVAQPANIFSHFVRNTFRSSRIPADVPAILSTAAITAPVIVSAFVNARISYMVGELLRWSKIQQQ
jgi:hypothetical protein